MRKLFFVIVAGLLFGVAHAQEESGKQFNRYGMALEKKGV